MIDINPNIAIKSRLQATQKKVSRGLILSELITNAEETKPTTSPVSILGWDSTEVILNEAVAAA
jgi:hypothetical protein